MLSSSSRTGLCSWAVTQNQHPPPARKNIAGDFDLPVPRVVDEPVRVPKPWAAAVATASGARRTMERKKPR